MGRAVRRWFVTAVAAGILAAAVPDARAQAPVQAVRVASGPASVLAWQGVDENRVATVSTGTILDVLLQEADWYWVMLPPDAHGARRSGWIRAYLVEPLIMVTDPAQRPVLPTAPQPPEGALPLPPMQPEPFGGGFIQGLGGATFGDESSSTVGGLVAVTVAPNIQVTAEIGRMQNVMPKSLEASLIDAAGRASTFFFLSTGQPIAVTLEASVPALYGTFGVRGWIPTEARVRPYADFGVGFANVMPDFSMRLAGRDVTSEVLGFGILVDPEDDIEPLIGVGGGVLVPLVSGLAADIGYRYQRVFTGDGVNVNRVTLGLAYRF